MADKKGISRRDFLRGSAAVGLGLYGVNSAMAAPRVLGANDRILIGMIGVGNKGTSHLRNLVKMSQDAKNKLAVTAICDIYDARKQRAKDICGGEVYHEYRKLLERPDLDAVVIASPDHWHARMAIDAMQAGKDVYLEKPMTYTWQEAKEVAAVVKQTGRVLQVGAQSTSGDQWWQANRLIKEGAIGKVLWSSSSLCRNSTRGEWNYAIDEGASPDNLDWKAFLGSAPKRDFDKERFFRWRKYWDYSGGIATDLFYHQLSHLQIALGPEFPKRVSAGGGIYVQHDRDVPDTFHMIIDYPTDHSVVLCSSMANRQGVPEFIRGHEATMYFESPGIVIRPEDEFKDQRQEVKVALEPRLSHMDNFLDCVRTRNKPHLDADTAYRIMVAIALGVQSYREERIMRFDPEREKVV
ncbi:MAG TPA: Gfo/Idh/MocA family oxidoreductase [Armatimonadota bacterium]|nr:Gfo/Idh/MocA family oxidoreductase [Armatimonadota bacterium]